MANIRFGKYQVKTFSDYRLLYWIVQNRASGLKDGSYLKERLNELMRKIVYKKKLTKNDEMGHLSRLLGH